MAREVSSFRIRRLKNLLQLLRDKGEHGITGAELVKRGEYANKRALQDDLRMLREEFSAEIKFIRTPPAPLRI